MLPRQVDVRDVARAHVLAAEVRAQQKLQYLCTYALMHLVQSDGRSSLSCCS